MINVRYDTKHLNNADTEFYVLLLSSIHMRKGHSSCFVRLCVCVCVCVCVHVPLSVTMKSVVGFLFMKCDTCHTCRVYSACKMS